MVRVASWMTWSLWALSVGMTALSLLLLVLNLSHPDVHVYDYWLENTLSAVLFSTVGAIVASRRAENPVGWLFCLLGLAFNIGHFSSQYVINAQLAQPDLLPAGQALAWISSWILPPIIGLQVFSFLLFPTGRLPSKRWMWLVWLTVASAVVGTISSAFSFGANAGLGPVQNLLGIEGFSNVYDAVLTFLTLLTVPAALSPFARLPMMLSLGLAFSVTVTSAHAAKCPDGTVATNVKGTKSCTTEECAGANQQGNNLTEDTSQKGNFNSSHPRTQTCTNPGGVTKEGDCPQP